MGHEYFKEDPPPPPTGKDVLSSISDINVIFELKYKNLTDTQ